MIAQPASAGPYPVKPERKPHSPLLRWMRIGLTGRLFLLVVIAVLPALAIQAVNEYTLRSARMDDIRQQVIQTTKQFGEEIKEERSGAEHLLLALSQLDSVKYRHSDECNTLFAQLKSRFDSYGRLGAADTEGRIFCMSQPTSDLWVADTEFFKRAIAQDRLAVGNYHVDPATGEKFIHFALRFSDNHGAPAGVVFVGLDLSWLSEHLKERGLSPTASILIADREGNIIARLPHPEALVGKNMRKSHEAIMDGQTAGWEEAVGVDGVTRIFGYVPVALSPKDFFLSAGQSKAEAFAAIDNASRRGVILIFFGLAAAIYAAWAGGRRFIQRPVSNLLEATAAWRKGEDDTRVHVDDSASELGRLGVAFNALADALGARYAAQKRAEAELSHLNETLESRIARRTIELEEANRAKSRFLANMSHELRTPLNAIIGFADLMKSEILGPIDNKSYRNYIEDISFSGNHLLLIINDILDISRYEAGKLELQEEIVAIDEVVQDAVRLTTPQAAQGEVTLAWLPATPELPGLYCDRVRLLQILLNILSNAVKFTQPGGRVEIATDLSDGLALVVKDTGIGIEPENISRILTPFGQVASVYSRTHQGTGLGLSLTKALIEQHGGTLSLLSEPGRGTTVRLAFPPGRVVRDSDTKSAAE